MRLKKHLIASSVISTGIFIVTGSKNRALYSFASGILLDSDHIVDYWREYPLSIKIRHFFYVCNENKLKRAYLIFHTYELIFALIILSYITMSPAVIGITLGAIQHLVLDTLGNDMHSFAYFALYRFTVKFKGKILFGRK